MNKRVFLSPPFVGAAERRAVAKAFDTGYVAPCGPMVDLFEERLAAISSRKFAVAVSSGTAAMDLLMEEFGVDEKWSVIAPSLTFIATVGPASRRGADISFVDSDSTGNVDMLELAKALDAAKKKKKMVIGVDLYGRCCDYRAMERLCAEKNARLVMDSAEAVGASSRSRPAGSAGVAAVYSFNGNKIVTTSGGGAILTDDEGIARRAKSRSRQSREPCLWYEHREVGCNCRMSNILASLGLAQLDRMKSILAKRSAIAAEYEKAFSGVRSVKTLRKVPGGNNWLNVVFLRESSLRDGAISALEEENIESRPVWKPMHMQPVFKGSRFFGSGVSEWMFARGLCLPSGTGMSLSTARRVAQIVKSAADGR